MNQSTKQRIVGTLVLFIAALVLLQVLLDGEGSYQAPLESRIPTPPPFTEPARVIPERPVVLADGVRSTDTETASTAAIDGDVTATAFDAEPGATDDAQANAHVQADASAAAQADTPADAVADPAADPAAELAADPVAIALAEVARRANPPLDEQGLPRGWSVRLGVFANGANATALVDRLKASGHRAYARSTTSSNGPVTAVYVGPQIDRAGAEKLLEQLRTDFELNGLIVPYEIESR